VRSISQFNRDFLAHRYPDALVHRIHVIHVGIDPEIYGAAAACRPSCRQGDRPSESRRILCVASLQRYKGIPVLLDACELLKQRGVEFTCTIVGEGPMRPILEAQIRRLRLGELVMLTGARPQHEVAVLMRAASLLVMPSIVAPDGQMEGIPVAIMEAMAARLPVVASSLSGIPEAVEHGATGFLVEPGRASELALAIERVLSDGASRRMGDHARAAIERSFRLDVCVDALLRQIDRHNPAPRDAEAARLPALCAGIASGTIGLRRLLERRDSRVARLIVANGAAPYEVILKIHRSRPGESRPASERARKEFDVLHAVSRVSMNGSTVPRPLFLQAEDACVVMESCRGEPLDALIRTGRLTRDASRRRELVSAVHRTGTWLRHFQGSTTGSGDPVPAMDRLVETAGGHLDRCRGHLLPASAAKAVRSQLDALKTRLAPASLRLIRAHRDFWPGNIFVGAEVVEVIDFEGADDGLPYEDVAYFLVQLELFFPGPILRRRYKPLATAFLAGYLPADHGFDWAAYELCRIASALQILKSMPQGTDGLHDHWRRRMLRAIIVGGSA
jgi:aminoglycoside phosphotransferase (APT) family kinase protein